MAGLFERLFKVIQATLHAVISKFEDPIKLAEQGIRDLKEDFDNSLKGLAEVKAIAISTKRELEEKKQIAQDYENKALAILKNAQAGTIDQAEADRLASAALEKKQEALQEAAQLKGSLEKYNMMIKQFENKIAKLKEQIKNWENQIKTLKARHTVAVSSKKINQQLVSMSSDSTSALLEDMKAKINEEEALAEAYGSMESIETDIDKEINAAIGTSASPDIQASLAELKTKMLTDNTSQGQDSVQDNLAQQKNELENE